MIYPRSQAREARTLTGLGYTTRMGTKINE
jgi:hypothetical protein